MVGFSWQIPDYAHFTPAQWLAYALFGTLGLLVRLAVANARVQLPEVNKDGIKLNVVGEWITAVTVAILVDSSLLMAAISGLAAPTLVAEVLKRAQSRIAADGGGGS